MITIMIMKLLYMPYQLVHWLLLGLRTIMNKEE